MFKTFWLLSTTSMVWHAITLLITLIIIKTVIGWMIFEFWLKTESISTVVFFLTTYSTIIMSIIFFLTNLIFKQIKKIEALNDEIRTSYNDPLLKIHSRNYFEKEIEAYMKRAVRNESNIVFILIDANNLKQINDSLGHAAGDQMLIALAVKIKSLMRTTDLVFRYGGDEIVIIAEYHDVNALKTLITRTEKHISKFSFNYNAITYIASAAIGYSTANFNKNFCSNLNCMEFAKELIKLADEAMYKNKKNNKQNREP